MDEKDYKDEELLKEINEGIAKQVSDEMEEEGDKEQEISDMELEDEEDEGTKKRIKKRYIVMGCIGGGILLSVLIVVLVVNGMLNRIKHEKISDINFAESDLSAEEWAQYQESLLNATKKPFSEAEDDVINILLIGEEAMKDTKGRSDSMMIASINKAEKTLSLTSIMRDIYVKIPGYKDNKLNSAYNFGGGFTLTQTIEENFGIQIDGYVRVDFKGFEKIIDQLGGVDIELTSAEADYLNRKNYISNKKYRNVVTGWNSMNGNQALGYCRVRFKTAGNGEKDDFGRTYRQRTVLMAIFDKYKTKNPVEMVNIASSLFDYVYTNLTKNEIISYVTTAATLGTTDLRTFRVPMNNTYVGEKRYCGSLKAEVLVIDFEENIKKLREFIYGETLAQKLGPIPTYNQDIGINGTSGKDLSDVPATNSNNNNGGTVSQYQPPQTVVNPTNAPVQKPVVTAAPKPKATVAPTVEPTPEQTPEPTPESTPESTPLPTPEMTKEPEKPTDEPVITEAPAATPEVTATPQQPATGIPQTNEGGSVSASGEEETETGTLQHITGRAA